MEINEDGCIRYLMKEMDPSEEVEFEREMMEDENLLIEVESLRKTYQRLGNLMLKHPPVHITEQVCKTAVRLQQENIKHSKRMIIYFARASAVAAVFLVIASTAVYFGSAEPGEEIGTQKEVNTSGGKIEPWVDRNDILDIQDNLNAVRFQALQQEKDKSFNKLTLVNSPTGTNTSNQKILLTNSSN